MNVEGVVGQMNERLGGIEANIAGLRQEMNTAMGELRHDLTTNFRWIMGTISVMWVTIICTIMFV